MGLGGTGLNRSPQTDCCSVIRCLLGRLFEEPGHLMLSTFSLTRGIWPPPGWFCCRSRTVGWWLTPGARG